MSAQPEWYQLTIRMKEEDGSVANYFTEVLVSSFGEAQARAQRFIDMTPGEHDCTTIRLKPTGPKKDDVPKVEKVVDKADDEKAQRALDQLDTFEVEQIQVIEFDTLMPELWEAKDVATTG